MNERIQLILKTKNISASKFADEIGVQRSSISHIISGRNNPSLEFMQKIIKRFPDINSDWLLFGKGSMYNEKDLFSMSLPSKNTESVDASNLSPISDMEIDDISKVETQSDSEIEIPEKISKPQPLAKPKASTFSIKQQKGDRLGSHEQSGKKVERIIIFYSDKTFAEYVPE